MSEAMDQMEQQAAAWVARIDRDDWGDADELALQDWLAGDARRQGVLLRMQALWLAADARGEAPGTVTAIPSGAARTSLTRRRAMIGGAAALTGVAASAGALFFVTGGRRYSTELGEILRVPLEDGSLAAIDTDSRIEVHVTKSLRRVTVVRGQAWFHVAKDRARPFIVEAGPVRVRAVGTAFSVRQMDQGVEIIVTEGVVQAWNDTDERDAVRLSAGQRALLGGRLSAQPEVSMPAAPDRKLAWRDGKIDLAGTTLTDAAAEFNRYNLRRIVIADADVGAERFDGVFGTNDPMGFAIAVRDSLTVPIDLSDPNIIEIGAASR